MSFFSNINQRFLKGKISARESSVISLKKTNQFLKILVITNQKDEHLINEAKIAFSNAEINALYLRKEKEDKSPQFNYTVHPSDFNLTGRVKNDKLNKLLFMGFDMVIDLSDDSVYLKFILAQIKSTLVLGKIGEQEFQLHDLFFDPEKINADFIKTVVKHLNVLTKNEK
ncbi:MAG: hypothetical protein IPO32_07585 [Crocinitomicaceae bacterium]|nr:hypothetical protein [Crocinitomicaceae bacterium]